MSAGKGNQKKVQYFEKLISLLEEYPKILIISCDFIGSAHMQKARKNLRGKAVMLMGKNTMIRRAIRDNAETRNKLWLNLLPFIYGNVGLLFTKDDPSVIRTIVEELRIPAAAKANVFAPKDVFVPKGMTTLEPTKTNFLQALGIASKVNKGQIEILNDIHLIKKGERVGSSEAALLQMLDVKPFEYSLRVDYLYDSGDVMESRVLDFTNDQILEKFFSGVNNIAAFSLATHIPSVPAFPHIVINGFKNLVAVTLDIDFEFKQGKKLKDIVKNPAAYAAAAPVAAASSASSAAKPEEKKVEEKPKEPSEEAPPEFDLFG